MDINFRMKNVTNFFWYGEISKLEITDMKFFLHPEISSRFSHNIGITGKRNYDTWDNVKEKDNIFSVLEQGGFKPLTKEQLRIKKLINK